MFIGKPTTTTYYLYFVTQLDRFFSWAYINRNTFFNLERSKKTKKKIYCVPECFLTYVILLCERFMEGENALHLMRVPLSDGVKTG